MSSQLPLWFNWIDSYPDPLRGGEVIVGDGVGACVASFKFRVTQVSAEWFYAVFKDGCDYQDSYIVKEKVGPYRTAEEAYKDAIEFCWLETLVNEYLWLCMCDREIQPPGHPGGCQYCFGLKKLKEE